MTIISKHIVFTVTNDLNYDQRMIRICNTLQTTGYRVTLIGRRNNCSLPLQLKAFQQKRLFVLFKKGPLFYIYYNIYLFIYLLFIKADCICAIDLDTIMPVYFAASFKGTKKTYDAHEYFSQLKEVVTRPHIYKMWHFIEKKFVPKFRHGYTVSKSIAAAFRKLYGVKYLTIRNMPLAIMQENNIISEKAIIYQGAVNEARGFEYLIPAMVNVNARLYICGDGNFEKQAKKLVIKYGLEKKVIFKGKFLPNELNNFTKSCYVGINLVEPLGLNQYFSLANKFFDYIQQQIPQVTMNFPEYSSINQEFEVAVLLSDLKPTSIAEGINRLLNNTVFYEKLRLNCTAAREEFNWQKEEKKLIKFYNELLSKN